MRFLYDDYGPTPFGLSVLIVLCMALILAGGMGLSIWAEKGYCADVARLAPDHNFEWTFFAGCLVEAADGRWVSAHDYLQVEPIR